MTIEELISYTEFLAHADAIGPIKPEQSRCVAALLRELVTSRKLLAPRPLEALREYHAARRASDAAMAEQPAGGTP